MSTYSIGIAPFASGRMISIKGYVNKEAAAELSELVLDQLQEGNRALCIDLSECTTVNSPAVGALLELTLMAAQDHQCTLVFTGMRPLIREFFDITGIFENSREASSRDEAATLLELI